MVQGAALPPGEPAGEARRGAAAKATLEGAHFFRSPRQAVPIISDLLRREAWTALSRYYDLIGSSTARQELVSGDFFVRRERPEVAHPAGFWRTKHPFPPGFTYQSHSPDGGGEVTVTTSIEIDQGTGMVQRAVRRFRMRESSSGWQILPGAGDSPGLWMPTTQTPATQSGGAVIQAPISPNSPPSSRRP